MKEFKGKAIYNPGGKAREYSEWAVNFYNGCSARCEYCYNRKGRSAKVLGGDKPTLKKTLIDENTAYEIFKRELYDHGKEIQKTGLFFNFVSDPMLPETFLLNSMAMRLCVTNNIPVKILTKQTWWVDEFIREENHNGTIWNCTGTKDKFFIGFTLTGHDELEPGAARNQERIIAMHKLHNHGFKTWASIEPIIDFVSARDMIIRTLGYCDLLKVGLQSGKKYDVVEAQSFVEWLDELQTPKIYLKESLQKLTRYTTEDLDEFFVYPDYLW
ncbi:MAG: hypothetical protein JEY96_16880 [Bacteroidales bacterium]|nr:hypothetical protein [Bacteroidales bacterium]